MDRDSLLNRPVLTTEIPLSEGQSVKARKLSQAEVERIRRDYATESKVLEGFRFIVSRCVLNDDGGRMFSDGDMQELLKLDYDVLEAIALGVSKFSGLNVPKNT